MRSDTTWATRATPMPGSTPELISGRRNLALSAHQGFVEGVATIRTVEPDDRHSVMALDDDLFGGLRTTAWRRRRTRGTFGLSHLPATTGSASTAARFRSRGVSPKVADATSVFQKCFDVLNRFLWRVDNVIDGRVTRSTGIVDFQPALRSFLSFAAFR